MSVPSAVSQSPWATAEAEPDEEPPGTRSGALRVERRAVEGVLAEDAERDLVGDGLADQRRAGVEQALHRPGVARRDRDADAPSPDCPRRSGGPRRRRDPWRRRSGRRAGPPGAPAIRTAGPGDEGAGHSRGSPDSTMLRPRGARRQGDLPRYDLARDPAGRMPPRRAVGVLGNRQIGAGHDQRDVVRLAHRRDRSRVSAAARAHSGQSLARTVAWIHERRQVSAARRPRAKSSRRTRSRVQPWPARRRAVNGERITPGLPPWRMPKSEAAEPITLASSSSAAGDVDHGLGAQHRDRALIGR